MGSQAQHRQPVFGALYSRRRRKEFVLIYFPREYPPQFPQLAGIDSPGEGDEVVSGGYKAINRDLEDGKKVTVNTVLAGQDKQVKPN